MPNTFYSRLDAGRLHDDPKPAGDYRSPFQRDRDGVIYSSAFRRLQAKTQVFLSGEYDFYRTRLTHSIEVAQIGRSLCHFLRASSPLLADDFHIDPDLVEAACLAHDLGHPPFGHAGERTLHELMRGGHGGFEGNAQSLRILTETIYSSGDQRRGLNPARATIDAILKYKTLHSQTHDPENHFLYDGQADALAFVFDGADPAAHLAPGAELNALRSIECQIMDWADDTAYSLNDVADSVNAGFLRTDNITRWAAANTAPPADAALIEMLLEAVQTGTINAWAGRNIGRFIQAAHLRETNGNFFAGRTNRYRFALDVDPAARDAARLYKKLSIDLVFRSAQIQQLEHKGDVILSRVFETFARRYLRNEGAPVSLLPDNLEARLAGAPDTPARARLLCDHIAGMTDGFAVRTYKRLFDPDFGSLADLA